MKLSGNNLFAYLCKTNYLKERPFPLGASQSVSSMHQPVLGSLELPFKFRNGIIVHVGVDLTGELVEPEDMPIILNFLSCSCPTRHGREDFGSLVETLWSLKIEGVSLCWQHLGWGLVLNG